ncbi:MAG: hypothetical protein ABH852_06480 [Methanobacteriota archaeon]
MRVSFLLGAVIILAIILPLIGLVFGSGLIRAAAQVVLTTVLILSIGATSIFGYICMKAQARKWGAGLIIIAVVCLLVIFLIWTGKPLLI